MLHRLRLEIIMALFAAPLFCVPGPVSSD